jgi:hypothetical protein
MGLFDKLKQAANFVTGGGASVQVMPVAAEFDRTQPIKVRISAQIKDAPMEASAIYLNVRSKESVFLRKTINGKTENINDDHTGYTHKVQVSGPQTLEGGKSYDWEVEFTLPNHGQPSFIGTMSKHTWEVMGGLDVKGNDPDSGWVEIKVR